MPLSRPPTPSYGRQADRRGLKIPQKIAEQVFGPELLGMRFDQRILLASYSASRKLARER